MEPAVEDPLELTAEHMREIGYRTVDLLIEELTDRTIPATRHCPPEELRVRLAGPPPEGPRPWDELLAQMRDDVLGCMSRLAHRGYFAFIPAQQPALANQQATALDRLVQPLVWIKRDGIGQLQTRECPPPAPVQAA